MGFDHIIIGSRINGLVAAAMLSKAGKRGLILERNNRLGGTLRTQQATAPGFTHDVMAAWQALAPGDGSAHARDVGTIAAGAPFLFALLGGSLWSWSTARLLFGQALKRGLRGLAGWMGSALVPARGWLETCYQSSLVQALWAPRVLHCGLTPESTYSGQMGRVIAFALKAAAAPVIKRGSGATVRAFEVPITAKGGQFRTDVDEILVCDGDVRGVGLAAGKEIDAPSVMASVTSGQLFGRLLKGVNLPQDRAAPTTATFRHGRGNFQPNYALTDQPDWIADGLQDVGLVHLSDGIDTVSKSTNEAERGLIHIGASTHPGPGLGGGSGFNAAQGLGA